MFLHETFVQVYYFCVRLSGGEIWIPMQVVDLRLGVGHTGAGEELNRRSQYKVCCQESGHVRITGVRTVTEYDPGTSADS